MCISALVLFMRIRGEPGFKKICFVKVQIQVLQLMSKNDAPAGSFLQELQE